MHTDWSQFIGRFHPLLVHVPIGIILFAALLSVIAIYKKDPLLNAAISIALLIGAISAGLAAVSGYLLSTGGGYNQETVFAHKWIGIIAAVLTFITWIIRNNKKVDFVFLRLQCSNWLLLICIILIAIGGHLGGKMTHGDGYLTRYMPAWMKSVFSVSTAKKIEKVVPQLDSVIVYRDIIQPILTARCAGCHNTDKTMGELDLTSIEGITKGGKSGKTIVAGDPGKSELFYRISLPPTSSKFMPSDNSAPLTPIELSFISQWIKGGAGFTDNLTKVKADEKTKFLVANYLGISTETDKEIKLPAVKVADSAVVQQLNDLKILVHPLTSKSNLLEASFVMVQQSSPAEINSLLQKLMSVKLQLYRLDVNGCNINKDGAKIIAGFTKLNKLEIQKTNLSDEAVEPLADLPDLEILNLGQNPVTDKSAAALKKMKTLKKLNLWQTHVSEQVAKDLLVQFQGLIIER